MSMEHSHTDWNELAPKVMQKMYFDPADVEHLSTQERRRFMHIESDRAFLFFSLPGPDVHSVTDHYIGETGQLARVYRPSDEPGLPAYLFLHGGAWWLGHPDELINDAIARQRCVEANCVVVALDYRLAPEHPFPAGLDDCYTAINWMADNARELGIDAKNMAVGGASAGGNLAAALCLKIREEGGPKLVLQLLEVPMHDLTLKKVGWFGGTGFDVPPDAVAEVHSYLVGDDLAKLEHLYCSPLYATDFSNLPRAHTITGGLDPLAAQGEAYAKLLADAGVESTITRYPEAMHSGAALTRVWEPARRWHREAIDVLKSAFMAKVGA